MKEQSRIKVVLFVVFVLISLLVMGNKNSTVVKKKQIDSLQASEKLIRLHVVANSNSLQDQHIKREVRDLLSAQMRRIVRSSVQLKEHPQEVIKEKKEVFAAAVNNKLRSLGVNYRSRLEFGEFEFPTRSYGQLELTAGDYKALRVVLGAGQGENWWCVLFPPLCFVDSRDEVAKKELKKLSNNHSKEELTVEFKLKYKEFLKNNPQVAKSKLKWIKILQTSFPGVKKLMSPSPQEEKIK